MRPPRFPATIPVRHGSVWRVEFDPSRGAEIQKTRPAVVLSADGLNRVRRTTVVVPVFTGPAPRPPVAMPVPSAGEAAVAICDQLRAMDRSRLTRMAGMSSRQDLRAVEDGVRAVFQL